MTNRRARAAASAALITLLVAGAAAQGTFNLDPDLVFVYATVTGQKNAHYAGLKQDHFQILENNKEQKVGYFSEQGPWVLGVVVGVSTLLPGRADNTSQHIRAAVGALREGVEWDNGSFVDELPFGSDGIFDAISRGLYRVKLTPNPRKALIVITDGFDTTEGDPGQPLKEFAKKVDVPVYLLFVKGQGFGSQLGLEDVVRGNQPYLSGGRVYEEIASLSGGWMTIADAEYELAAVAKRLAQELTNYYVLGFNSANDARDGKWRNLKIKVNPPPGAPKLKVNHKSKYFVPKAG